MKARICKGCGKPKGCDCYQFGAYWHLGCLLRERAKRQYFKETKPRRVRAARERREHRS